MTSADEPSSHGGAVRLDTVGDVAVIRLDDGKANALSHSVLDALATALDGADGAAALAVIGRPGKFCAGFDLNVMRDSPGSAAELMAKGARIALRLFEWPRPTVLGVTGHALAMGAVLLGCADVRIGAAGAYKIGFNEIAIGLPMPEFAIETARVRLSSAHLHEAVALARIYTPEEAVKVGFLDEVSTDDHVADRAVEKATELGSYLEPHAFARTRITMRRQSADEVRISLGDEPLGTGR